jgi:hypothetical protein
MYKNEMQMESIDCFDKYLNTINDKDKKVDFSLSYFGNYSNASNPDQSALKAMFECEKELEKEYYDDVDYSNKAAA